MKTIVKSLLDTPPPQRHHASPEHLFKTPLTFCSSVNDTVLCYHFRNIMEIPN